jgi:hypothetical protein
MSRDDTFGLWQKVHDGGLGCDIGLKQMGSSSGLAALLHQSLLDLEHWDNKVSKQREIFSATVATWTLTRQSLLLTQDISCVRACCYVGRPHV